MNTVPVQIVRFVESHQPNIVECMMTDATGRQWNFIDKHPVFTMANLDEQSSYPQLGVIACEIVSRRTDASGVTRKDTLTLPLRNDGGYVAWLVPAAAK